MYREGHLPRTIYLDVLLGRWFCMIKLKLKDFSILRRVLRSFGLHRSLDDAVMRYLMKNKKEKSSACFSCDPCCMVFCFEYFC
ncbi:unnamed protein product [Brassica oleracea var. botrytis]